MNYYNNIKQELLNNEINRKVKNYSINKGDLNTYYIVGKMLSEAGKHYGEGIIKNYSLKLMQEVDKKYNTSNLKRMRQFYWLIEKGAPLGHQLSWTHYKIIIPLKDFNKINYYINQTIKRNLSKRQLEELIKLNEYERLSDSTKDKLINKEELELKDLIPNPIVIKNTNNKIISEKALQKLILEDIPTFLKQLGDGFTFIDNEYPIKIGDSYNYIDILLFNYIHNCFVVVELKVTNLKKEHIGQIEVYMNYIDDNIKTINQNKTIGIIIVRENNKYIIKYSSNERIISTTYELI